MSVAWTGTERRPGPGGHDDMLARSNLSTSQYLLWLGQRLHPGSPLYNMALAFDIEGPLDAERFGRAFHALVARSDALRTVLDGPDDDAPRQRVLERGARLESIDLSASADAATAATALIEARAATPFAVRETLLDSALIRLAPDRHVWFLNQHHLITDGWATTLVYRHVADLYRRSLDGSLEDLPVLPQYGAFVEYERGLRHTPVFRKVREHWQRRLQTQPAPVRLYGLSGAGAGPRTARLTADLGVQRSDRIRALAATLTSGALTPDAARFNIFATALFAWVCRVSGLPRLAIGTPAHNRATATLKATIGPLIELFPLTAEVGDEETFRSLLDRVRAEAQSFLRYAQPGASTPPLMRGFNVVLNYIHATFPAFAGLPMRSRWVHSGHGDSRHHLRLQVHDFDASGSFVLHFDFNCDLFDESARPAAGGHFLRVLDAMLEDPARRIRDVALVADRAIASVDTRPAVSGTGERTVAEMIAAQATRTPDAVALSFGDRDLSYAELTTRAFGLARHLKLHGVEAESRVGICLERSPEAIIAILAVLFAGGAFVPLSPADPAVRTQLLLDDAGVRVLITSAALRERLAARGRPVVLADGDDTPGVRAATPPAPGPAPGDAAYVLYTSGSTGRPKGVVVEHASLAGYITWARDFYLRGRVLDFPLHTSLAFDLTLTSLFLPLVSGGRVVVYAEQAGGAATLVRVFAENRVDAVKLTPSHLTLLAGSDLADSRVRMLIVGGEDLKRAQAEGARRALGDVEIFNEYGPTEATVGCMIHRFDPERDTAGSVPIGRAAGAARIDLLDDALNPVPPGVTGEICVGGPGVARGYLDRPELTAARFVPDPLLPGGRMYRTGDRGRMRGDGVVEFLGRGDDQLKVRGARVEPAEVEAALLTHPAIEACAVDLARSPSVEEPGHWCLRCGLPSNYPGATFDDAGVCHLCRDFEGYRERVKSYFRPMDELHALVEAARARRSGAHDCVMLLSGGKDSTYALSRLVGMGADVLAFTLDNGYLSEGAKANIRRVTERLGVDHVFGSTPAMNAIFVDSLNRHANVCNGCFKTIYTLGARLARQRGIPLVVTGLSRGQFFETRLTEELFRADSPDTDHIDRVIMEARRAYHRADDAVARLLDTRDFQDDTLFEDVRFVDFYRYCDVRLDEMLAHLAEHVPWIRPEDTGRSTNCLINDVGIFVHRRRRGHHNYAFPYSWDVRVGHKTREAALRELTDEPDVRHVERILDEIGYDAGSVIADADGSLLVAWYVSREPLEATQLREHLARTLPSWMLPARFVRVDSLPLTPNGKVDRAALRTAHGGGVRPATDYVPPDGRVQQRVADIWQELLGVERVGAHDEFTDLGGNSLVAIRVISRVNEAYGIELPLQSAFEASTVAALAALVEKVLIETIRALSDDDANALATDHPPAPHAEPR